MRDNLIYGRQTVKEFIKTENTPRVNRIFLSASFPLDLKGSIVGLGGKVEEMPRRELDRMFPGINHQGVVLELSQAYKPEAPRDFKEALKLGGPFLALDEISDPQNLGSMIRTAESLGVRALFASSKCSPITPAVHRASSGASMHLPVYSVGNLPQFMDRAKEIGIWMVAAVADTIEPTAENSDLSSEESSTLTASESLFLMIGSEGEGLKSIVIEKSDYLITIPMRGRTASLNAGVACGILLDRLINR
ncbi:MAG: 23S rRNA (guanosine(2251)-2'-O)-methyltransferase RlmB [Spirochaetia bacterium]|nr:23S rRNA (guanosine(2251)-2'-O)-methyltransferase RlmB [Spirochaetia bacterium]